MALYRQVVFVVKDSEVADYSGREKELIRDKLMEIMANCLRFLKAFVRQNAQHKSLLIREVDLFLEFNLVNVGQVELLSSLFINNPGASSEAQAKMVAYFCQKIQLEGNQAKFLEFFHTSVVHGGEASLSATLDLFLPYSVPRSNSEGLNLLYGLINPSTEEHQFNLMDEYERVESHGEGERFVFKNEPFLYHARLLSIFLALAGSEVKRVAKLRLRKYFSVGYLFRFLLEEDCFYEKDFQLPLTEAAILECAGPEEKYKLGVTSLKPQMARLLYTVYCEEDRHVYRSVVSSLNVVGNLMAFETERLLDLRGQVDPSHRECLLYLLFVRSV